MNEGIFSRTALLFGEAGVERLRSLRVIIFGVGGVGSWCAESLVRTGVGHLTMVDCDVVCDSNINRQLMATTRTVGRPKVEVMRERLLEINPEADITALQEVFSAETAGNFDLDAYDYVIDAIDSLRDKALLILRACESKACLFSSMGAARKLDPQRVKVTEFWKVEGDPLARTLRKRFKHEGVFPARKFQCVYSDERPTGEVGGTAAHVTAVFGLTLASRVIQDTLSD
ncbi:MAG: tRNA threonylcarbamoyladenosine dehydratase [Prevotella sp.]|nr:tRNA threonylcarbamoyladenosine dehydratase [Prevotella sp.]